MRFHLVSLPHTQTLAAYQACAFTNKVRLFAKMMKARGHTVFLYAGDQNEAPCDELVTCVTEAERQAFVGDRHYSRAQFDGSLPHWRMFNMRAAAGIVMRHRPGDFVCVIGGHANKRLEQLLPEATIVEFGIGYGGTFAKYRVFESYAWMHTVYGARGGPSPNAAKGDHWYDAVIPGYFEPEAFPLRRELGPDEQPYFLFVGRLGAGKGENIAVDVCKALGHRLILAGPGSPPDFGEYVGEIGPEKRGELMAGATAVFMATTYVEPFGNVAVEAQASGTPVISTDWGAMTETVEHGFSGYRCRSFHEFCEASTAEALARLAPPAAIRQRVIDRYSLDVIGKRYEDYFERLSMTLGNWYARPGTLLTKAA